jgi:hypothetical protein
MPSSVDIETRTDGVVLGYGATVDNSDIAVLQSAPDHVRMRVKVGWYEVEAVRARMLRRMEEMGIKI